MYKVAAFDFDGTLVDSTPGIIQTMREVIEEIGESEAVAQKWGTMIGIPLLRQTELLFPDRDAAYHEDVANRYRALYDSRVISACPPFPGVADVLAKLKASKVHVTIATSKRRHMVELVLAHYQLYKFFDLIVAAQDVSHHKPHPESMRLTLSTLNVQPSEAVMVGDTTYDLDMAANAGVDAIGVTTGVHSAELLKSSRPRHIVNSLQEAIDRILDAHPSNV